MTKATGKMNATYGGKWDDPEKDEILYANYGTLKARHVATRINKEFGTRFTEKAIHERAQYLGIKGSDCQGMLTITDAAKELGVQRLTLNKFILANDLPMIGQGYFRYLSDDAWRACQANYPKIPEPCITPNEAGKILGFAENTIIKNYIRKQKLRAYKFGLVWRVAVADVERMVRERRGLIV